MRSGRQRKHSDRARLNAHDEVPCTASRLHAVPNVPRAAPGTLASVHTGVTRSPDFTTPS